MSYYSSPTVSTTQTEKDWIPLVEFAHKKGISLSTLRRHIKAGKIPYKVDQGRYLLFDDQKNSFDLSPKEATHETSFIISALRNELQQAREEVAELKTLIAFYEERTQHQRHDV
jgi:predicted DNA-binding transcriptional regulator AlpA